MYELIFSDTASTDLIDIVEFIAKDSIVKAVKYKEEMLKQLKQLSIQPLMGAKAKLKRLNVMGYRILIVKSHIVYYRIEENKKQIYIIRILHSTMNQEKHL